MPIASINPSNGETIATFEAHSHAEVDSRLDQAVAAHGALRLMTIGQRAQLLIAAADILDSEVDFVARTMTLEMGKTFVSARAEAIKCVAGMRFYAEHTEGFLADEKPVTPESVGAKDAWVTYQPLGCVLAVMPWNYPAWQVMRFAAPALMAGNACVLKHASNVPQTAMYLESIFARAGFPDGSFVTLLVGAREVAAVIEDKRITAVTLTGSEGAGVSVAEAAGRSLKKTVLELGGTDPFLVLPSADLTEAAGAAARSRTQNTGQSCICAKRFIVHTNIYDEFMTLFREEMASIRMGDPFDPNTDIGPLATAGGLGDIRQLLDDAVAGGATVSVGGLPMPGPGYFFPATVVEGVSPRMRLWSEEAFGPVAAVFRVKDFDEGIAMANNSDLGLSSSVWTTDANEQACAVRDIEAGAVFINGTSASHPGLPFGGIKRSGYGRELAANGIREFCNIKTVWRG